MKVPTKNKVLFYIGFFLLGLCTLIYGGLLVKKASASKKWPSTKGTFQKVQIRETKKDKSVSYLPVVEYSYTVDGKDFKGNRVSFWDLASSDKADVDKTLKDFYLDKPVDVIYNPKKPSESVLIRGEASGAWNILYGGFVVWILGLAVFIFEVLADYFGWQK